MCSVWILEQSWKKLLIIYQTLFILKCFGFLVSPPSWLRLEDLCLCGYRSDHMARGRWEKSQTCGQTGFIYIWGFHEKFLQQGGFYFTKWCKGLSLIKQLNTPLISDLCSMYLKNIQKGLMSVTLSLPCDQAGEAGLASISDVFSGLASLCSNRIICLVLIQGCNANKQRKTVKPCSSSNASDCMLLTLRC